MGKGTMMARAAGNQAHADALEDMLEQLLIVFLKRLGGKVEIPCKEIDDTAGDMFAFRVDPETRMFHFTIQKKQ